MATCEQVILLRDGSTNTNDEKTYTQTYFVQFSDGNATPVDAEYANDGTTSIPYLGYSFYGRAVKEIQAERMEEDKTCFTVTVSYTNKIDDDDNEGTEGEPWQLEFNADAITFSEEISEDINGDPIVLPTGEPVNPALQKEYYDEEFTIGFNQDTVPWSDIQTCRGKINSDNITLNFDAAPRTFSPKTLRLTKANIRWEGYAKGWRMTYYFVYRPDTFTVKIQAKSFHHLDGTSGLVRNVGANGQVLNEPQFLNADGTDYVTNGGTLPSPLEFEIYEAVAFTTLLDGKDDFTKKGTS